MSATLQDQGVLGSDPGFTQKVRQAMITAALAIASDGLKVLPIDIKRHTLVQQVLNSPDSWKAIFAAAVATDATVSTQAISGLAADGNGNYLTVATVNPVPPDTTPAAVLTQAALQAKVSAQVVKITDASINNAVSSVWNAMFGGQ